MSSSNFRMFDEAKVVVNDTLNVRSGERVTVLSDFERRNEAEVLALAAHEAGAEVLVADISHHVGKVLSSTEYWTPPPAHVIAALQNSNVNIFTVNETYAFRIAHHIRSFVQMSQSCSAFKLDPGMGSWGLTRGDVDQMLSLGKKLMSAVNDHNIVRVTTRKGTDIKVSVKNRPCLPILPVPARGLPFVHAVPLWNEYNWAPVEDSSEGKVVIDGISEATPVLHVVSEPVEWTVKAGRVVEVRGAEDANEFRSVVETDEGSAVIGELGIGGSHKALFGTESEKARLSTVHFGLGDNSVYPGGRNRSKVHVDGGVRQVTVEVDGKTIIRDGIAAL